MQNMIFIGILWCFIAMVTSSKYYSHTIESFTKDNQPCIGDCIDNKCLAEVFSKVVRMVACTPGNTAALKYYTTQQRSQEKFCSSRCGRFAGKQYDWCYVSADVWDYCRPERVNEIVINKVYVESGEACQTPCQYGGYSYKWCYTFAIRWGYCDPDTGVTYAQSKTVDGVECLDQCGKHGSTDNWCVGTDEMKKYCAAPARDFSVFTNMFRECMAADNCRECRMQIRKSSGSDLCHTDTCNKVLESGFVSNHAKLLESPSNNLATLNVSNIKNPIYTYTIMPKALAEDPILPLLVRAKVTKSTINQQIRIGIPDKFHRNVQSMGMNVNMADVADDEYGELIGHLLGGPDQLYNFVPKSGSLNAVTSHWKKTELRIREFVNSEGGWAEITIVVVYHNLPRITRPDGFAVNVELYNSDYTLHDACRDQYYSNDPHVAASVLASDTSYSEEE